MKTPLVENFHFHIYYELKDIEKAKAFVQNAFESLKKSDFIELRIGRFHEKPVGPHPMPSCQITVLPQDMGKVYTWMLFHRKGLKVFCHPNTGNDLLDHTEHVFWLGDPMLLNLEMFQ